MWHRASCLAHASCVAQTVAPLYHVPVGACAAACGVLAVEPDGDLCVPLDPSVFDVLSELAPAFIRCVMDVMPDLDQVVVRSSRVDCLVASHLQRYARQSPWPKWATRALARAGRPGSCRSRL